MAILRRPNSLLHGESMHYLTNKAIRKATAKKPRKQRKQKQLSFRQQVFSYNLQKAGFFCSIIYSAVGFCPQDRHEICLNKSI